MDPIAEAERQWRAHGWPDEAAGMAAVTNIVRIHQLLTQRIDGLLRPFGLTFARYEVLMLLTFSSNGALPMAKIGQRLQVHPASVTSAVDRLESQGFVIRKRPTDNRRLVLAELTDKGRRVALEATDVLNGQVFADLGLPSTDVSRLRDLVTRLRAYEGDAVEQTAAFES